MLALKKWKKVAHIWSSCSHLDSSCQCSKRADQTFLVEPCPSLDGDNKINFDPTFLLAHFTVSSVSICGTLIKMKGRNTFYFLFIHLMPHGPILLTSLLAILNSADKDNSFPTSLTATLSPMRTTSHTILSSTEISTGTTKLRLKNFQSWHTTTL